MGEIETRLLGIHQRTPLFDMLAEHMAQGPVEQVRSRVITHDVWAVAGNFQCRQLPRLNLSLNYMSPMQDAFAELLRRTYFEAPRLRGDNARVANLTTLFRV